MNIYEMNEEAYLGNFGSDKIEKILDEISSNKEIEKREIVFLKPISGRFQTKEDDFSEIRQYRRISNDNSN